MTSRIARFLSIVFLLVAGGIGTRSSAEETRVPTENQWIALRDVETLTAEELPEPEPLPGPSSDDGSAGWSVEPSGAPIAIDSVDPDSASDASDKHEIPGRPYNASGWYSKPNWDSMTWRTGTGNRFGEFGLEAVDANPVRGWDGLSITDGYGFHFLGGPNVTDMPPRLFDFNWGLHWFGEVTDRWWLDLALSGGLYTDFEDSVREGWRFPAHAVATWEATPEIQPVLGIRYFDRDNLGLLPVAGLIVRPEDGFRLELVFPEPRVAWRISSDDERSHWLSISGRIGGGEWAIERRPTGLADVVTYNEYQLVLSLDTHDHDQSTSSLEIGYLFERELEYRSGAGNSDLPETFFIRLVNRR